ncbi:MAG: transporter [Deltaproteobacteria bacterium]|nr:transporter [Deltaproteobacteria bacterium]
MKSRTSLLAGILVGAGLGVAQDASAFPIHAPNARTVFSEFTVVAPRFEFTRESDESGQSRNGRLDAFTSSLDLVYGASRDFTLGLNIPYAVKRLRLFEDGAKVSRRSDGVGDLSLVGAYRVYRRDDPLPRRGSTQFSLIGGLKLPSGSTTESDSRGLVPPDIQPGSGSVDGILGGAFLRNIGRFTAYASVQYKINSEATTGGKRIRAGNNLHYDLVADYLILAEPGWNVFGVLELNGVYKARTEENGVTKTDSGGNLIFLSPGLEWLLRPYLILELGVQLPIVRQLNGRQLEPDYSVLLGLRYFFR